MKIRDEFDAFYPLAQQFVASVGRELTQLLALKQR